MNEEIEDKSISVQKLCELSHFNTVLRHNLDNLSDWKKLYPNHEQWITDVINNLKSDQYSRIAFGGFYHDKGKSELCCSAIVKKNPFTPYLEIKNLIVFKYKYIGYKDILIKPYQRQLIKYIIKFAEQRGYSKLVTELSKKSDKELINVFLENDFFISGTQLGRYKSNDEILFLTHEVNQFYGHDPYDNFSTSAWILTKYLNCEKLISNDKLVSILSDANTELKCSSYSFYSGKRFDDKVKEKFNTKNLLIIVEENYKEVNNFQYLKAIDVKNESFSNVYVFDFTKEKLTNTLEIEHKKKLLIFERNELISLVGQNAFYNKQVRFEFEEIGGLLLISDPKQFDHSKANNILSEKKNFIYLKMGDYGSYLNDNMPLVFAYYPENTDRTSLQIWGICNLGALPFGVDINELKQEYVESVKEKKFDFEEKITDADILYKHLNNQLGDDNQDQEDNEKIILDIEKVILWSKEEFNKHNNYNETNKVICFIIKFFLYVKAKHRIIKVGEILDDLNYVEDTQNLFDFYLSKSEINKLYGIIKTQYSNEIFPDKGLDGNESATGTTTQHHNEETPAFNKESNLPIVVILTAIKEEYLAVQKHLQNIHDVDHNDTGYEAGIFVFNGKEIANVIIRECGTSNVIASQETERAFNNFKPQCILFVGIAGSRKPHDFSVGDVIFPHKIYSYENGKASKKLFLSRPQLVDACYTLMEKAKTERRKQDWKVLIKNPAHTGVKVDLGVIASGEQLIEHNSSQIGKILTSHFNDTSAVEMEGFGFAKAAIRQGRETSNTLIGVIRGISDIIEQSDEIKPQDKTNGRPEHVKDFASDTAAAFAFWLIYKTYA